MAKEQEIEEIVREISLGLIGSKKGTDSILSLLAADRAADKARIDELEKEQEHRF